MKATELRIGNYFIYDGRENIVNGVLNKNGGWRIDFKNECKCKLIQNCQSIPLTEDWLLKFGFDKKDQNIRLGNGQDWQPEYPRTIQNDYVKDDYFTVRFEEWHYISKEEITIDKTVYITLGEWYSQITEGTNDVEIKYVHQLQNLYFALTNEELTIK